MENPRTVNRFVLFALIAIAVGIVAGVITHVTSN